ncbi:MAG: hypothetical protein Q4A06_10355 [Cardiobacteriaceae bacterium]|nr:hypothetical protein [Cardiobacteriaceae bacterium]
MPNPNIFVISASLLPLYVFLGEWSQIYWPGKADIVSINNEP